MERGTEGHSLEGRVGAKVQRKKYTDCLEKSKESSFRLWGEHEKR